MQQINNLSARVLRHASLIKMAVERVINSGWYILGPEGKQFEGAFSSYIEVAHCVSLANGTDAIEIGLKALGIVDGDRVATVANAGMYTTTAILAIGAKPHFMDVDLNTALVTFDEVRQAINSGAKAVVVTHLYGIAIPDISKIADYCKLKGVALLEDCAQAHGARVNGKLVGSFGNVASFSFYPTKNLGALGDAGAIVTNDISIAERARMLRTYGWSQKYTVELSGARNSRLDEIQAAILNDFLPFLDDDNLRRREIANRYISLIDHPHINTPPQRGDEYVAHLFVLRTEYRSELRDYLQKNEIASDVHYPIPDYRQPVFNEQSMTVFLKNTEQVTKEILTIPCYPEMSNEDVDIIISVINRWVL